MRTCFKLNVIANKLFFFLLLNLLVIKRNSLLIKKETVTEKLYLRSFCQKKKVGMFNDILY